MLETGDRAPAFELTDDAGNRVSLEDFSGKHLIVYFYPKAMTPGCTTEACDFRDRSDRLQEAGYAVVGISPDPPSRLARFKEKEHLNFPLLSDEDHAVAEAYGAWGTKKNYGREYEGIIRSTFVIGPDGTVIRLYRNVRATGHVDRLTEEVL
ncbi:MAG: thioredoxin-dependent thiol peroxidase [Gammaproteobacteria bacterium]|nr:thioredoxin-dependent thiol peroxidase [Gammaproteobacteria bacterium]